MTQWHDTTSYDGMKWWNDDGDWEMMKWGRVEQLRFPKGGGVGRRGGNTTPQNF